MREVRIVASGIPLLIVNGIDPVLDPGTQFTPGPFFKEGGILIGKLLCLALLAKILVLMIVEH